TDIVIDAYGSAGPLVTRAVALGSLRFLRDDRLTLRFGYSHMSSLAINMYLSNQVYNRVAGGTFATIPSFIENNLTGLRSGGDEGRITVDVKLVRRLGMFVEGRVRYRSLIGANTNPSVYLDATSGSDFPGNEHQIAYDATLGLRDGGSLAGIRANLIY